MSAFFFMRSQKLKESMEDEMKNLYINLKHVKENLNLVLSQVPEGILIFDKTFETLKFINPVAIKMLLNQSVDE